MIALDASALLALLRQETGHEFVAARLKRAAISAVNLAEVYSCFARDGYDLAELVEGVRTLGIEVVPFSDEYAQMVAKLLPLTKAHGLSLGDRACLALAISRSIPALTADKIWSDTGLPVEVVLLPERGASQ